MSECGCTRRGKHLVACRKHWNESVEREASWLEQHLEDGHDLNETAAREAADSFRREWKPEDTPPRGKGAAR